jgi:hypothetical protein
MDVLNLLPHTPFHYRNIDGASFIITPYGASVVVEDENDTIGIRAIFAYFSCL